MTDDIRRELDNQITSQVAKVDQIAAETGARFGDVFLQSAGLSEEKRGALLANFVERITRTHCYKAAEPVAGMLRDTASIALAGIRSIDLPEGSPEIALAYSKMVCDQLQIIADAGKLMAERFHELGHG